MRVTLKKRLLALVIAFVIVFSNASVVFAAGDVTFLENNYIVASTSMATTFGGSVNLSDVFWLRQYITGNDIGIDRVAADINGDGRIDETDVRLLREYLGGHPVNIRHPRPLLTGAGGRTATFTPFRTGTYEIEVRILSGPDGTQVAPGALEVSPGDYVYLQIYLATNDGFVVLEFEFGHDPRLELVAMPTWGVPADLQNPLLNVGALPNPFDIGWMCTPMSGFFNIGALGTFRFRVLDTATPGTGNQQIANFTLNVVPGPHSNLDYNFVDFIPTFTNSSVRIVPDDADADVTSAVIANATQRTHSFPQTGGNHTVVYTLAGSNLNMLPTSGTQQLRDWFVAELTATLPLWLTVANNAVTRNATGTELTVVFNAASNLGAARNHNAVFDAGNTAAERTVAFTQEADTTIVITAATIANVAQRTHEFPQVGGNHTVVYTLTGSNLNLLPTSGVQALRDWFVSELTATLPAWIMIAPTAVTRTVDGVTITVVYSAVANPGAVRNHSAVFDAGNVAAERTVVFSQAADTTITITSATIATVAQRTHEFPQAGGSHAVVYTLTGTNLNLLPTSGSQQLRDWFMDELTATLPSWLTVGNTAVTRNADGTTVTVAFNAVANPGTTRNHSVVFDAPAPVATNRTVAFSQLPDTTINITNATIATVAQRAHTFPQVGGTHTVVYTLTGTNLNLLPGTGTQALRDWFMGELTATLPAWIMVANTAVTRNADGTSITVIYTAVANPGVARNHNAAFSAANLAAERTVSFTQAADTTISITGAVISNIAQRTHAFPHAGGSHTVVYTLTGTNLNLLPASGTVGLRDWFVGELTATLPAWLTIAPTAVTRNGTGTEITVAFVAVTNPGVARNHSVVFTAGNTAAERTVAFSQSADKTIIITGAVISTVAQRTHAFPQAGGSHTVVYTLTGTNLNLLPASGTQALRDWFVGELTATLPAWITIANTAVTRSDNGTTVTVIYTAGANAAAARNHTAIFTASNVASERTVAFSQEVPAVAPVITGAVISTVAQRTHAFPLAGGNHTVVYTLTGTNLNLLPATGTQDLRDWFVGELTVALPAWITVANTDVTRSGDGTTITVIYTASVNTAPDRNHNAIFGAANPAVERTVAFMQVGPILTPEVTSAVIGIIAQRTHAFPTAGGSHIVVYTLGGTNLNQLPASGTQALRDWFVGELTVALPAWIMVANTAVTRNAAGTELTVMFTASAATADRNHNVVFNSTNAAAERSVAFTQAGPILTPALTSAVISNVAQRTHAFPTAGGNHTVIYTLSGTNLNLLPATETAGLRDWFVGELTAALPAWITVAPASVTRNAQGTELTVVFTASATTTDRNHNAVFNAANAAAERTIAFTQTGPVATARNLTAVTPDGVAGTTNTTQLVLTFSDAVSATIASGNITITNTTAVSRTVTAGTVTGSGNTRTVAVSGTWNNGDTITVAISGVAGYAITATATAITLHRDITQPPVPDATMSNVTIGNTGGSVVITLANDTFAATLSAPTTWITNLPVGMTQTVVRNSATQVTIAISGTPTVASTAPIAITIPAASLVTSTASVAVTANPQAVFATTVAAPAPSATAGNVSIGNAGGNVVITLANDTFATTLSAPTTWITNLPAGMTQTATRNSATQVTIAISGTPTAASTAQIAITIPTASLVTSTANLTVIVNPSAVFATTVFGNLSFSIESIATARRGEAITVPIHVSNNPGFAVVGLVVTYNPNVLQITGVTAPVAAMPLNPHFELTASPGTQWISLMNTNTINWYGTGTVAYVTFNVLQGAGLGASSISLSFIPTPDGTPSNAAGVVLRNANLTSGFVNVVDVNGNGNGSDRNDSTFQGIMHPASIFNLSSGTPATVQALGLPWSVFIHTSDGGRWVSVQWQMANLNYNPTLTHAQSFTVHGTVMLPFDVVNPQGLSLMTSIHVSVNALPIQQPTPTPTPAPTPEPPQDLVPPSPGPTATPQPTPAPLPTPTPRPAPTPRPTPLPAQVPLEPIVHPEPIVLTTMFNGRAVNFTGQAPILTSCGTTLIPVREVFEMLGYTMTWDASALTATITHGRTIITITEGSRTFTVHGFSRQHDNLPAQIVNGHLMVPFVQLMNNIGVRAWRDEYNVLHLFQA